MACGLTAKHTQGPWPVTSEDRLMKRGGVGGGQRDEQGTQAVGGAEGDGDSNGLEASGQKGLSQSLGLSGIHFSSFPLS